jgi:hypothetical protein
MSRRIFLTTALDRLLEEGKITRRSNAVRILKLVIDGGVTALDESQREFYDQDLVPKIEELEITFQ